MLLLLAIVSVIFAPAILRSIDKNRAASAPQASATAAPSFDDAIQNIVKQKITDALQQHIPKKSNAPTPKVAPTPPPPPPAPPP
jgi:hypothetical protein